MTTDLTQRKHAGDGKMETRERKRTACRGSAKEQMLKLTPRATCLYNGLTELRLSNEVHELTWSVHVNCAASDPVSVTI